MTNVLASLTCVEQKLSKQNLEKQQNETHRVMN
jgi:hypothetical protein